VVAPWQATLPELTDPVEASASSSDAAEVGWEVSLVLARPDGSWWIVEVDTVYP